METQRRDDTRSGFAGRAGAHCRNGAPHVEKVWTDATSCAAHVDATGAPGGARNRAAMIEEHTLL
jgi:hypothetical protein